MNSAVRFTGINLNRLAPEHLRPGREAWNEASDETKSSEPTNELGNASARRQYSQKIGDIFSRSFSSPVTK